MRKPKVCVLRTAGTNCDQETAFAFFEAGGRPELLHINTLISGEKNLEDYQILAIPGGFSYGDDVAAGKILANELRFKLRQELGNFIHGGRLIIGICNGFQILVKSGFLPGNPELKQEASLIINDSAKFEDRWVYLSSKVRKFASSQVKCIWTKDLPEIIYLPVAHGEGKFITKDKSVLKRLREGGQVVFQYCDERGRFSGYPDNPNGSEEHIAGITDATGRILGLMPHPERHISAFQHPRWQKMRNKQDGDGMKIFINGVEYARENL